MNVHPAQHRIDLCNRALESVRATIPDAVYREVHDYVNRHDEWGLGMETLIDYLSEFDLKVTREQFELIRKAMAAMGLGASDRVDYLREHHLLS